MPQPQCEARSPGGGGNSHMKLTGIYIVSLRGVNFGLGYTLSR